jgi:hypothetical protein
MSSISIENLGYDMNMDREAMDAIAGGWLGSSVLKCFTNRLVGPAGRFIRRTLFRYF